MKHHPTGPTNATIENDNMRPIAGRNAQPSEHISDVTAPQQKGPSGAEPADTAAQPNDSAQHNGRTRRAPQALDRGLTAQVHPTILQRAIWLRALVMLDRFRVIRTFDVALACFPERPFKAALTAAQHAMRGMSKAGLVQRYRTDRFQHVYALTVAGSAWLEEYGIVSSPSTRRVADMTNPEHQLWMDSIVLACEARGLSAHTESEALRELNRGKSKQGAVTQGFVKLGKRVLRPDALAYEADGVTWFEIDRSKRGPSRKEALSALAGHVGSKLKNGLVLRRVVVLARTERILQAAWTELRNLAKAADQQVITDEGGRHFKEVEPGIFEVWATFKTSGGLDLEDKRVGHIIVQMLPTWLPKFRLSASNRQPLAGWFDENYLPYRRPQTSAPWPQPTSPLLDGLELVEPRSCYT